ncbi:MAG: hypothetical protein HYW02_04110 [Deltaproteobacteria bacterium]|nr:hypothetical protein [Deltaproteobacteria bacterium]
MRSIPIILLLLFAACCTPQAEQVARHFANAYYQRIDLEQAEKLTDGLARDKVEKGLLLTRGQTIDSTTRPPEVKIKLLQGDRKGDEGVYLFLLQIQPDQFEEIRKEARIRVRLKGGEWKVTQFSEHEIEKIDE